MPCNGEYLNAGQEEVEYSRVSCLIDELNGTPINPNHWRGYHPRVYNNHALTEDTKNAWVAQLCSALKYTDVTKYSLEMQMWWRDHQAADKARIEKETRAQEDEKVRAEALAKLTNHEKKVLGLK